jgi:hypothetical protein
MTVIEFEANLPDSSSDFEKLKRTMKSFDGVREKIMNLSRPFPLSLETQEHIANEFGSDRFAVEDILRVLLDQTTPIFPEYRARGFWTLGRCSPRFGTPWGTLVFDENSKTIQLMLRYGGSFEDYEDPPLWLRCLILSTSDASYDRVRALSETCKALDIWWHLKDRKLTGKLVFR